MWWSTVSKTAKRSLIIIVVSFTVLWKEQIICHPQEGGVFWNLIEIYLKEDEMSKNYYKMWALILEGSY